MSTRKRSEATKSHLPSKPSGVRTYNKDRLISLNKVPNKYNTYGHNCTLSDVTPKLNKVSINGQDYYSLNSFTYSNNFNGGKNK